MAYRRGHLVVRYDSRWRWADTGRYIRLGSNADDPACVLCGRLPTSEGYDPCVGHVPGAASVCCGHGVTCGHVTYPGFRPVTLPMLDEVPAGGRYPHPLTKEGIVPMAVRGLPGDLWQFLDGDLPTLLVSEYFERYAGRAFNTLGGPGDAPAVRHTITPSDLVAVTLLSVAVPAESAIALLNGQAEEVALLLRQIPSDVPLWTRDAARHVCPGSYADQLWTVLRRLGLGPVTTSKLMARKRPVLIPIYDSVIQRALLGRTRRWWQPMWGELQNSRLVARLRSIRAGANLSEDVSLLRVLDVAVWMRNQGYKQSMHAVTPLPFLPRRTPTAEVSA